MMQLRSGEVTYLKNLHVANNFRLINYSASLFLAFPVLDDWRALQSIWFFHHH